MGPNDFQPSLWLIQHPCPAPLGPPLLATPVGGPERVGLGSSEYARDGTMGRPQQQHAVLRWLRRVQRELSCIESALCGCRRKTQREKDC